MIFQILDLRVLGNLPDGYAEYRSGTQPRGRHGRYRLHQVIRLADISKNNILINAHMLEAAKQNDVKRYLFSSSACVYAQSSQKNTKVTPLKEGDCVSGRIRTGLRWGKAVC